MKIEVLRLLAGDPIAVECTTPAGRLLAIWRGAEQPTAGATYDVEIDVLGELEWGKRVNVDVRPQGMFPEGLVGLVEDVDDESVVLRVLASVVLLEVLGDPPLGVVGRHVLVSPEGVALYPTGL